jgi:pimeloyl-ACP methyl ester carboxylesterase
MAKKHLVLIHGFLEDATMWKYILPHLSKKNYVIQTPELPGHGRNAFVPEEKSAEAYCANLLQQISLEDGDSAFIIGHSMGGYLSASLAAMVPDNISGMCFFQSKAGADNQEKIRDRMRAIAAAKENKSLYVRTMLTSCFHPDNRQRCSSVLEHLIAEASKLSTETITGAQEVMISRPDRIDTLKERKFPLYYFLGEKDPSLPLDIMEEELKQLPGSVSHVITGIGHMGYLENTGAAVEFLQRIMRTDI